MENQLIAVAPCGATKLNSWAGTASGEGCFFVRLRESSSYQMGYNVLLKFQITQHIRDSLLLKKIIDYLECGYFREIVKNNEGKFEVESLKDVIEKIIPFFNKYPRVKQKDFLDFKQVAELMKSNAHKTPKGSLPAAQEGEIQKIKSGMNKGRKE